MFKKLIANTTILVLILTIISIAALFFYELGVCKYYNIPSEYISLELNNYGLLLFTFSSTLLISILTIDAYVSLVISSTKISKKWKKVVIVIILIGIIFYPLSIYVSHMPISVFMSLLLTAGYGGLLIITKLKPSNGHEKFSIFRFLSQNLGEFIGPILITSSFICAVGFSIGYISAQRKITYPARSDNKTLLLKKYNDYLIYGILNDGKITQIIIEHNLTIADTLHYIKIK